MSFADRKCLGALTLGGPDVGYPDFINASVDGDKYTVQIRSGGREKEQHATITLTRAQFMEFLIEMLTSVTGAA